MALSKPVIRALSEEAIVKYIIQTRRSKGLAILSVLKTHITELSQEDWGDIRKRILRSLSRRLRGKRVHQLLLLAVPLRVKSGRNESRDGKGNKEVV
jgi:CRP-like cAMP-binding protein